MKSDQEPSVGALQTEIQRLGHGRAICANSPIGKSECNGRAESAVRHVEVKTRTLRSALEAKLKGLIK